MRSPLLSLFPEVRLSKLFGLALLGLSVSHCSIRTMAIREVSDLVGDGVPAFERDDDPELIKAALPANIKLLEAMLESDKDNTRLLSLLSQMYASYTFGFVEADLEKPAPGQKKILEERVNRLYQRGIAYGQSALGASEGSCSTDLNKVEAFDACLKSLSKDDVPALFWYGFNIAAYINRNLNSVEALSQGAQVEKAMERVIQLDETYNFGCAHVLLLAFYGSRPPMMGGSPEKARQHYERVRALNKGQFWLADVFYARYALVQSDDQPGFEKLLKDVSERVLPGDADRRLRLYNSLAKDRAKLYLGKTDELF